MTITSLTCTKTIRIHDVSAGGCLLESQESLAVGSVGLLSLDFDGRHRREWIRIRRVHADDRRRGVYLVSAEFLPLEPAGADSLRGAVLRLQVAPTRARIPALSGRSSGDPGKFAGAAHPQDMRSSQQAPADRTDSNFSCTSIDLATPLLNVTPRACPKPEKE